MSSKKNSEPPGCELCQYQYIRHKKFVVRNTFKYQHILIWYIYSTSENFMKMAIQITIHPITNTNSRECKALNMYSIHSNLWWKLFPFLNLAWETHSAHKLGQITDPSLFISVQDAFLPSTSLGQIERFLTSVPFYKILEEMHTMANSLFQLTPQIEGHGLWINFHDSFTS